MKTVEEFAPAKINLTLHITGQRADGYHLLDSLVCFADIGDRIRVEPDAAGSFILDGPEAEALTGEADNLVLRAARLIAPGRAAAIRLTKHLPVASGIGGGSTDAAATLRAMARAFDLDLPPAADVLSLGADVPVCLAPGPVRMQGIGDRITRLPQLPEAEILLVNPRVSLSTPSVFQALGQKDNAAMPSTLPVWADLDDLSGWLACQRNDLRPPAIRQQPVIAEVLEALAATGARFSGMSGSGATCFALFAHGAEAAAQTLRQARPHWWVKSGAILPTA